MWLIQSKGLIKRALISGNSALGLCKYQHQELGWEAEGEPVYIKQDRNDMVPATHNSQHWCSYPQWIFPILF